MANTTSKYVYEFDMVNYTNSAFEVILINIKLVQEAVS